MSKSENIVLGKHPTESPPKETTHCLEVPLQVDEQEVLRYQGYGPRLVPSQAVRILYQQCYQVASQLARPCIFWRILPIEEQQASKLILPGSVCLQGPNFHELWGQPTRLLLAIGTIGAALEAQVSAWMDRAQYAEALMLDSIGSAAVTNLVAVGRRLLEEYRRPQEKIGCAWGPGDGHWPLDDQQHFFRLLKPTQVTLSSSMMMQPLKSLTFAIPLGRKVRADERSPCQRCSSAQCVYRQVPPEGPLSSYESNDC